MNNTVMIGRFARDPELRSTRSGKSVVNFILAVPRTHKDDGCDWIPVIVWDKLAELVKQYCHKGDPVGVRGHMQTRDYESNGQKRTAVELVAEEVEFLGRRERKEAQTLSESAEALVNDAISRVKNHPAPQSMEEATEPDEELPY